MSQSSIITGASCRLIINGKIFGAATSISVQRDQGVKPIIGIDSPIPQEIAPTGPFLVKGQITGLRTRDNRGFDGLQIVNASSIQDYFNQKYCTIELVDRKTNITIAKIHKCIFHTDSFQVSARQIVTITASFTGTFMSTEISS